MKRSIKSMLTILSLALVLSICVSVLTACPNGDGAKEYTVSIGAYDNSKGTVTIDKEKVEEGKEVTVTVTSKEGYEIKSFFVGSNNLTADFYAKNNMNASRDWTSGTYTFKVNRDSEVRAEFQVRGINGSDDYIYTLTPEYDVNKGTVTVSPDRVKFAENEAVTLNIEPNNNFVLTSILVDGVERVSEAKPAGNNYTYNFTFNITKDTTVKVVIGYDVTKIDDVTAAKFDEAIKSNEWVLVDFWSTDCGFCTQVLGPSLKALTKAKKLGNVRVIKVELNSLSDNSSDAYKLKEKYRKQLNSDSTGLPFVVLFKDGVAKACHGGAFGQNVVQSEKPTIDWLKAQGVQI